MILSAFYQSSNAAITTEWIFAILNFLNIIMKQVVYIMSREEDFNKSEQVRVLDYYANMSITLPQMSSHGQKHNSINTLKLETWYV